MADPSASTGTETRQQNFERVLAREPFKGLRAILQTLSRNGEALCAAVCGANSYGDLVTRLGYRITLTKQIHVQDSYSRVGPEGGIKAVLPYFDIPTHSSLPTLIHYDSTLTTTSASVAFFDHLVAALKKQLSAE